MPTQKELLPSESGRIYKNFEYVSYFFSVVAIAVGVLGIFGWITNSPFFYQFIQGKSLMQFNTALCFALSGTSLFFLESKIRMLSFICSIILSIIALHTLISYFIPMGFSFDNFFFKHPYRVNTVSLGRMSGLTAINSSILGISLIVLNISKLGSKYWIGSICSTFVLSVCLAAFFGYLFKLDQAPGFIFYTRVSIPTMIAFIAVSIGLCFRTLSLSKEILLALRVTLLLTLVLLFTTLLLWRGFEINTLYSLDDSKTTSINPVFLLFYALIIFILFVSAFTLYSLELHILTVNSRFKIALDNANLAISDWDEKDESKFKCVLYYDSIGVTNPEGVSFEDWLNNIHEADREDVKKQFNEFVKDPSKKLSFTARILSKENKILWIRSVGQPLEEFSSKKIKKFILLVKDITSDRQYAQNIKNFGELLNSIPDAVIGISPEFAIKECNKSSELLLGYTTDELKGELLFDVLETSKDEVLSRVKENSEEKYKTPFTAETTSKDGTKRVLSIKLSPLFDYSGQIEGYSLLCHDQTEEQKLSQKEKEISDLRHNLMTIISHEMRDPVTVIKESIQSLLAAPQDQIKDENKEVLKIAENNIEKLSHILHETLDHQMLEIGEGHISKNLENLNSVIQETISELKLAIEEKHLQLELSLDENLPQCYIDKDKVHLVLQNLLSNAIKFTNEGHIKITTSHSEHEISCSIEDTGQGIEPQMQDSIFEMFSEAHKQKAHFGAGIGLSLVKKILTLHSGRIEVHSEPQKGSVFTFILPLPQGERFNK